MVGDARPGEHRGAGPLPSGSVLLVGHGLAARRRGGHARLRARRVRLVAGRGRRAGRRRRTAPLRAWRAAGRAGVAGDADAVHHLPAARGGVVHCTRRSTSSLLVCAFVAGQSAAGDVHPRPQPRGDLDRDVAASASPRRGGGSSRSGWPSRWPCSGGLGPFAGTVGFVIADRSTSPRRTHQALSTRYSELMAVDTSTIQVVMPAMGDSVAEGTVLEWHKQEGDAVAADETLGRDLDRQGRRRGPLPGRGHDRQDPRRRGRHRRGRGAAGRDRHRRRTAAPRPGPQRRAVAPRARRPRRRGRDRHRHPDRRRVGHRGHDPRVVGQGRRQVKDGDTVVEISTDKVDMELPAPGLGTITEILPEDGETVSVGQVIAGCRRRRRAGPPARASAPAAAVRRRHRRRRPPLPAGNGVANASPVARRVAAAEGVDLAGVAGQRPRRPDHQGRRARCAVGGNGASTPAPRRRGRAATDQGRRRRAGALHGREPLDPDRDLVPHADRHDARRPAQAAQGRRAEGLLHPPDRLRDRPGRPPRTCR